MTSDSQSQPRPIQQIGVYCGSATGSNPAYAQAAAALGQLLAREKIALVYGGGKVGLMGVLADAVLAAKGEAIGVMPRSLVEKEIAHTGLTHLHVVESMHQRKQMMVDLADAFVLLPGGFGSWEEFCETVTWLQLGIHRKPCAILNAAGYYNAFLSLMDHAAAEGFLRPAHKEMIIVRDDPASLLSALRSAPPPAETKWVKKSER